MFSGTCHYKPTVWYVLIIGNVCSIIRVTYIKRNSFRLEIKSVCVTDLLHGYKKKAIPEKNHCIKDVFVVSASQ
jgi:hypothetical protein